MSGAFSTAKPACSTEGLCSLFTSPRPESTDLPSFSESLMVAVCERSSSVRARLASFTFRFTPPMRSDSFSRCASQRAAAEVALLSDSANTEEPRACGCTKASACTETNRSACTRRALATRSPSGMK